MKNAFMIAITEQMLNPLFQLGQGPYMGQKLLKLTYSRCTDMGERFPFKFSRQ